MNVALKKWSQTGSDCLLWKMNAAEIKSAWFEVREVSGKPCLKRLFWILPSLAPCLKSNIYNFCVFLFISVTLTSVFHLSSYLSVTRSRDQIRVSVSGAPGPAADGYHVGFVAADDKLLGGAASHRVCLAFQIWCVLKSINGATWRHEISPCRFSQELLSKPEQACEVNLCHHDTRMPHLTPRKTPGQAAISSKVLQGTSRNSLCWYDPQYMTYIDHQWEDWLFLRSYYSYSSCLSPGQTLTCAGCVIHTIKTILFRSSVLNWGFSAWGKKLLCSLVIQQRILLYLLPECGLDGCSLFVSFGLQTSHVTWVADAQ